MSNFHTSFHQKRLELNFHYLMDSPLYLPNLLKVMYAFSKFFFIFVSVEYLFGLEVGFLVRSR